MEDQRPPKRLPREYRDIWRALAEADRLAKSRADLARRLRVSTFTLQRILVDGDVPQPGRSSSTRVVHSWTRILTRLACYFGKDPRRWVEQAGIPWNETIQKIVATAERDLAAGRRSAGDRESTNRAGADLVGAIRTSTGEEIEIGVVDRGPFSAPLPDYGRSFLEEFTRRLILSVDPSLRLRILRRSEQELLRALVHPGASVALGSGLAATVARRRTGLTFITIPGWRLRFLAVGLASESRSSLASPPTWAEIAAPGSSTRLFVRAHSAAHQCLAGGCGLPAERLIVTDPAEDGDGAIPAGSGSAQASAAAVPAEMLVDRLQQEAAIAPERPVYLVDDEAICGEVFERLQSDPALATRCQRVPLSDRAAAGYPLALALPSTARTWCSLLRLARNRELFGSSQEETARLYAGFIAATQRGIAKPTVRLEPFRGAGPGFRAALIRELLAKLEHSAVPGSAFSLRTIDAARRLVPDAWHPSLEEAVLANQPHPRPWHCQSCSASLYEEHNQGPSDRYCRHCSDEQGRLRPREEVRRILARWFANWQGELPPDQADRRVDSFMQAMPAWSEN